MNFWEIFAGITHLAAACSAATLGVWLLGRRERLGEAGLPLAVALALSAGWAITVAATGSESAAAALVESIRNLALLLVVWRLFRVDGRHTLMKPVRPMIAVLAALEIIQAIMMVLLHRSLAGVFAHDAIYMIYVSFRLMLVIGGLVLLHNLFSGASQQARLTLRWPAAAISLIWLFDLNLYTVGYLDQSWPVGLAALRGVVLAIAVTMFIPALAKRRDELHFSPSRAVAFQFVSLAGIALYLIGMMILARWISFVGGDYAQLLQFGVLIVASTLGLLALPSRRVRGWLKVTLVKHLFRHRYDYRSEWLRFAQTIGRAGEHAPPLEERAVQAIAQITDSPAGLLLTPGDHGDLVLAGRWQWPSPDVPGSALGFEVVRFFEQSGYVIDLDALRGGKAHKEEADAIPQWLLDKSQAWALVPLRHHERLVGLVVLARPAHVRQLDWEDFDLLRVVGQQLATTIAEHTGQDALAEAARFDEFNRRIAFVMHDIKNLASQFSLLARNAEHHAENPEFRADMLVTLRNSADKLNALIARLSRYRSAGYDAMSEFDVGELISQVAAQFSSNHQVVITENEGGVIIANRDALEQALIHLVQNAVDASYPGASGNGKGGTPVFLSQTGNGLHVRIEIVDSGAGMTPEFVRSRLFKPFVSSKQGGFGIGAFEARELIRAMKGRLDVESREDLGTRFIIHLPLSSAAELISTYQQKSHWSA